eukprot:10201358-Prorocentrum_lima.AAC.1
MLEAMWERRNKARIAVRKNCPGASPRSRMSPITSSWTLAYLTGNGKDIFTNLVRSKAECLKLW